MRILLGMSGGVDSTYAAIKLKELGYEIEGAVLKMHEYTDVEGAVRAAEEIGIPIHVIDAQQAFSRIKDYFVEEYANARTPNPCVVCNSEIKFPLLLEYAEKNRFDAIATGHYARVVSRFDGSEIRYCIARGRDEKKDQSYMLYRLSQRVLEKLVLPLGNMTKEEVKRHASEREVSASVKKESQEICFIPDNDYPTFIKSRVGEFPEGDFIDKEGRVIGRHKGIIHYTVGQRKGLGIALGSRAFVTDISKEKNTVTLDTEPELINSLTLRDVTFSGISGAQAGRELAVKVKLRYLAPLTPAKAVINSDGSISLTLESPMKAVTPGQCGVIYDADTVIAGGFIV